MAQSTLALKPSQVNKALRTLIAAQQPTIIWGPPGVGKSDTVRDVADALYAPKYEAAASIEGAANEPLNHYSDRSYLRDVRAVLLDPVDLRGLPHINGDGRAHWATPSFLPVEGEGIFFLDELNRAPALVQNACFQLVLDRRIGDYVLPAGWTVVAACNRESDGGGITRMPSALANRFTHIEFETDLDDWCTWAVTHEINPVVIAFLRFKPNLLHSFDRDARAFPTPRSWAFVSRIMTNRTSEPEIERALVAGSVGDGASIEFLAFVKLWRNMPSIDAILLDPKSAPVPRDIGTLYAVTAALGARASNDNFGRVIQYLNRLPDEYSVFGVRDATCRDEDLAKTNEFIRWAVEHKDVLS